MEAVIPGFRIAVRFETGGMVLVYIRSRGILIRGKPVATESTHSCSGVCSRFLYFRNCWVGIRSGDSDQVSGPRDDSVGRELMARRAGEGFLRPPVDSCAETPKPGVVQGPVGSGNGFFESSCIAFRGLQVLRAASGFILIIEDSTCGSTSCW